MIEKKRNYGIDLLRMLSMFMIVILHILGQGGVMVKVPGSEEGFYASWFLETCAYCAVDCYGIISGYVGLNGKHRFSRLFELWFQVFFYCAGITLLYALFSPGILNWDNITRAIFPVSRKAYWYFSAYVGLFFVMPYLNLMVNTMSERAAKQMAILLFAVFSCGSTIPRAIGSDFLQLAGGYSCIWLCILYLLGACIRKCNFQRRKSKSYLLAYLGLVIVSWGSKILIEKITLQVLGQERYGKVLIEFTSPTILLCAVFLFLIFEKMELRHKWCQKLIVFASPLAFSVYIIHTNPLVWNNIFKGAFSSYSEWSWPRILIGVPVTAMGIYAICTLIDAVRMQLFKVLRIKAFSEWIEMILKQGWSRLFLEKEKNSIQ